MCACNTSVPTTGATTAAAPTQQPSQDTATTTVLAPVMTSMAPGTNGQTPVGAARLGKAMPSAINYVRAISF